MWFTTYTEVNLAKSTTSIATSKRENLKTVALKTSNSPAPFLGHLRWLFFFAWAVKHSYKNDLNNISSFKKKTEGFFDLSFVLQFWR